MEATLNIPDEETKKRALAEALERIRLAESYPVKGEKISLGQKRQDWVRPVKPHNFALK
jgi:hypothetical protein